MHAKQCVFDNYTLATGSCNLTHNGMENNKEVVIQTTIEELVSEAVTDFWELWEQAKEVTSNDIDRMMVLWDNKHMKEIPDEPANPRSKRSQSVPRSRVPRSLSVEFADAK